MTCCWSISWRPPFHPTCSGGSRATCTDCLPPASTDRPGLAFDLSGMMSLRAQSFPLASLTSSFPTTHTLQTSIVPMQTTSQPLSLTTIFLPPLSACSIMQWAADHGLQVFVNKSNCTLFTSDTHQFMPDPSVSCNSNNFSLCRSPKLLGVTFDTHFTFSPQIRGMAERARSRLGILKALAGVSWGQSKEVLLLTYQMLIKPILSYAAPVWFSNAPTTAVSTLQSIQNSALRIATGSLKMASTDHLHQEASVLPVRAHLSMLCSQFLLSALRPNHPSHLTVTADSGPRNIRHTLQSRFRPSISAHLIEGITQPDSYRESLQQVHSDAVAPAIATLSPNRLLGVSPPAVSASERRLPRAHRMTLSQLRSGFSSAMRDYRHRIGAEPTPECPECAYPCHSVPHLFSCPARPTDLSVATCGSDHWRWHASSSLSLPSLTFLSSPLPLPNLLPPHVPGGGICNNNIL